MVNHTLFAPSCRSWWYKRYSRAWFAMFRFQRRKICRCSTRVRYLAQTLHAMFDVTWWTFLCRFLSTFSLKIIMSKKTQFGTNLIEFISNNIVTTCNYFVRYYRITKWQIPRQKQLFNKKNQLILTLLFLYKLFISSDWNFGLVFSPLEAVPDNVDMLSARNHLD